MTNEDYKALIAQAWSENRPLSGELAVKFWELSNHLDVESAKWLMEQAGYVPWVGYPLQRSNRNSRKALCPVCDGIGMNHKWNCTLNQS